MAFDDKAENRGRDRLSLLPNTILIDILSHLPLPTAVSTEILSSHWRGLWTQLSSIDIHRRYNKFIHTFDEEYLVIDSSVRRICKPSLRHFRYSFDCVFEITIPSFIFQTRSLLSIDLDSPAGWRFPENIDPINLPNLVTLSLSVAPLKNCDLLEKLIESCPSLEKLSLQIATSLRSDISIKLSNANLRWLYITFCTTNKNRLLINAPKLRYLAIRAQQPPTVCFDEVPIGLHEAKIDLKIEFHPLSDHIDLMKFYEMISSVTILNISHCALIPVTIFRNVTHLTLTLKTEGDSFTILSQLVHFPKLNILILKVGGWFYGDGRRSLEDAGVSVLRQVKRIDIDADWDYGYDYLIAKLIAHLLKNATVLERFSFSTQRSSEIKKGSPRVEEREYMFCRVLYDTPRASKECEVSFTGRCLLMSGKTVPNVLKANGEVLPLNTELRREV